MPRPISFEAAKARYVHRFTCEHVPAWAKQQNPNGSYPAPQFATCREWYDSTLFEGESCLADKSHCYTSGQTWPHGKSLLTPFSNSQGWINREKVARIAANVAFAQAYETSRPDLYEVRT